LLPVVVAELVGASSCSREGRVGSREGRVGSG